MKSTTAGLLCLILGIILFFIAPLISIVLFIAALIFGSIGLKQQKNSKTALDEEKTDELVEELNSSTFDIIKEEVSCWNWQLIIGGLIFGIGFFNLFFSFFFAITLLVLGLGLLSIGNTKYKEKKELQERELKRKIIAAVAKSSSSEEKTTPAPIAKSTALDTCYSSEESICSVLPDSDEIGQQPFSQKATPRKRPLYMRWWIWAIAVIFLIGSCGKASDEAASTTANTAISSAPPTIAVTQQMTEPVSVVDSKTMKVTEEAVQPSISIETAVELVENVIKESFENYTITHNESIITINVWEYGIATAVDKAANGDMSCQETWAILVESFENSCSSTYRLMQDMGISDVAVSLNLLNDINKENTLLSTINGIVIYNCLSDIAPEETSEIIIPQTEETKSPREQLDEILETYNSEEFNQETTYVLNTNTMKFHYKWCSSADDIKPANRAEVTTTREDVISRGYWACKRCNP